MFIPANGPLGLRSLIRFAVALALPGLLLTTSCKKDESADPPAATLVPVNILQLTKSISNLTTLAAALEKTGLAADMSGSTQLTLFAPTDAAFSSLPAVYRTAASINAITDQAQIDYLRSLLLYHVISGEIKASALSDGLIETQRSATDGFNKIYLTRGTSTVFLNARTWVLYPDIDATNGVVHTISNVLMPPTQNILEALQTNSNFSTLRAAVDKTQLGNTLASTDNLTVFAPTNAAFRILPTRFQDSTRISAITDPAVIDTLRNILLYHTLNMRVISRTLSADITTYTTAAAAPTNTIRIANSDGFALVPLTDTIASRVTGADLMVKNGVIHVIDRAMRPVK